MNNSMLSLITIILSVSLLLIAFPIPSSIADLNDAEEARYLTSFPVLIAIEENDKVIPPGNSTHFTNMTDSAGVSYYGIGEGVAWGDYDGDEDLDLFVSNLGTDLLFENQGNGTFMEVASEKGIADGGYGRGTAWADYDNDGDLDLFLLRDWTNRLYNNDDTGHFTDIASEVGIIDDEFERGMAWSDFDNDGFVDLYLSSVNGTNYLYRSIEGANFEDIAEEAGVLNNDDTEGVAWGDYDNDGLQDLYITSKYNANTLYHNMGGGLFEDVTDEAGCRGWGVAYGVAWADYDNDLDLDLYVTTKGTRNFLFMNNGDGTFTDVTYEAGVEQSNQATGIAWGDYDNDGFIDLYVLGDPGSNILYHNNGNSTFTDITEEAGAGDPLSSVSVGLAAGDYNNDGFLDLYIANVASDYILFRNDGNANHWLKLKLTGTVSNKSAIGARIETVAGDFHQMRVMGTGCGFQSQNSLEVEFGFGAYEIVDTIHIYWPSGIITTLTEIETNQTLHILEEIEAPLFVSVEPLGETFSWGDTLMFWATITNLTDELQVFDAWTEVMTPWGLIISPLLGPVTVYLSPHHSISNLIGQIVPHGAPIGGLYTYTLKAGLYPYEIWAEDSFQFSIVPFLAGRHEDQGKYKQVKLYTID